ncbi:DapH/DapD/GlmU-related protein, partial [Hydrotalea sp.]|uniref:DapH/DapD/GlmU-related protein n=1 Tax=Hydrotalea sp. TaxID=2881279 RepID=UPI003D0B616D
MFYKLMFKLKQWNSVFWMSLKKIYWRIQGVHIGDKVSIGSFKAIWPHKIVIGDRCVIEHGVYFKYDAPYNTQKAFLIGKQVFIGSYCEFNIKSTIQIGDYSMIAS